mmetsp:Transcript_29484/g.89203  ORF Transcript_29484/g.89203 Transcript_29484/m.89203 type:complete len:240 (-) Transcript_29484:103-822(-)
MCLSAFCLASSGSWRSASICSRSPRVQNVFRGDAFTRSIIAAFCCSYARASSRERFFMSAMASSISCRASSIASHSALGRKFMGGISATLASIAFASWSCRRAVSFMRTSMACRASSGSCRRASIARRCSGDQKVPRGRAASRADIARRSSPWRLAASLRRWPAASRASAGSCRAASQRRSSSVVLALRSGRLATRSVAAARSRLYSCDIACICFAALSLASLGSCRKSSIRARSAWER